MRRLQFFLRGLRNWFGSSTLERETQEELAFHLESRERDLIRQGLSAADARRRARVEFGSVESCKEQTRDARSPQVLEDLVRDIGYGCRSLRRSPALVLTCVFSLGTGIGVNATIFTALRSVLLHQPTVSDPARTVGVEPGNSNQMSYPNYRDLRDSGVFDSVVAYRVIRVNMKADGAMERVTGAAVTGNFLEGLGVQPHLGRAFIAAAETTERHPRVAVLSHDFWRRRFNLDPAAIGRPVHLNGEPVDVIGILPAAYKAVTPIGQPDVYLPISDLFLSGLDNRQNANGLSVIARLRVDDTPQQAQMAVTRLGAELERRYPDTNRGLSEEAAVFPLREQIVRRAPPEVLLLPFVMLALFGLVLLIACGNVAGLLLARTTTRRHEIAVRVALGAKRVRLIQALLAETLILGVVSAAGGVLLTLAAIPILNALTLPGQLSFRLSIAPDGWLIGYAVLLALVTTIACGLVPALRGTRVNVSAELQEAGQTRGTGRLRLRHAFVIGQVALSAFLLVLSALLVRTAGRAAMLDPGFDLGSGVVARLALDRGRSDESRLLLAEQLTDRLQLLPGIRSTSVASMVPLGGDVVRRGFEVRGHDGVKPSSTIVNVVGPRYFETMGIPLVRGRGFSRTDRKGAPPVVVVNQAFARRHLTGEDPIGTFIRTGDDAYAEVVGVAGDTKFLLLTEDPHPLVYYSYAQRPWDPIVHVRVDGRPEARLREIQRIAEAADPTALVTVETLRRAAGFEITLRRGAGVLLASLGGLGLLLALVGLYGVMAYTVASRRGEIGLRMALGASGRRVVSLVATHSMRLVGIGLAIGVSASLLLTVPLRAMLAGVSPVDPIALAATAIVLLTGGVCASFLPARRASRVDPMVALRPQ